MSPPSPTQESHSDTGIKRSSGSFHSRKSSSDYRRYNNTVNHCGRHSNDWLFNGFSVRDTVRDGVDKLFHQGDRS